MKHKSFSLQIKTVENESGIIDFYGSTFGNIGRAGDMVWHGAFTETIERFAKDGVLCWQYNWDEPIGKLLEASEDENGLFLKAQLVLSIPKAQECYDLMKTGVIKKFSMATT